MFCVTSAKLKQSCEYFSHHWSLDLSSSPLNAVFSLSTRVSNSVLLSSDRLTCNTSPLWCHYHDVTITVISGYYSIYCAGLCVMKKCVIVCVDAAVHSRCFLCCETNCFLKVCVWIELLLVFRDQWMSAWMRHCESKRLQMFYFTSSSLINQHSTTKHQRKTTNQLSVNWDSVLNSHGAGESLPVEVSHLHQQIQRWCFRQSKPAGDQTFISVETLG